MNKHSLQNTNPYLKNSSKRKAGLKKFVISSSAIEGIKISLPLKTAKSSKKSSIITSRKAAMNGKQHR